MRQELAIVSDSSTDLPVDEATRLGIEIASIQIAFSTEYFRDDQLKRREFYRRLTNETRLPTIAAAMSSDFLKAFRRAHQLGEEVLCLINPFETCSTYASAYHAEVIAKRQDKFTVEVLNTGRALTGLGAVVIECAEMAARGAKLTDAIAALEEATPQIDTFYAPFTTEYLMRDGRLSIYEMSVGSLRGMLPLVRVWGRVSVVDKAKTQAENLTRMLARAESQLKRHEATVIVTHAENPEGAQELATQAKKRLRCRQLLITELGPSAGAYCGLGTLGIGYCPSLIKLN
jgi:DegV family protein with EDD domain